MTPQMLVLDLILNLYFFNKSESDGGKRDELTYSLGR